MADKTTTSLTAGTLPLVGTELVYGVQSGNSRKFTASQVAQAPHTQGWGTVTGTPTTLSGYGITDAQPLDSDLTAIAALTTTAYGRAFLALADAAAGRTALGLGTMATETASNYLTTAAAASSYQPLDSDLTAIAALSTTSYGRAFLALANEAAFKAYVNLEIGTDVQAQGATLTSLEGLSLSNGDILYSTGADTLQRLAVGSSGQVLAVAAGVPSWTSVSGTGDVVGPASSVNNNFALFSGTTGKLLKDTGVNAATFATAAQGLLASTALQPSAIGTTIQAFNANLSTLAAVTPGATGLALLDDTTPAAARSTIGAVIGTDVQAFSANLATLAAVTPGATGLGLLDDTTATAARTTLGAGTAGAGIFTASLVADVRDQLDTPVYVSTRTALKGIDTTKDVIAILLEGSRSGAFKWTTGNFSALVAADTEEGVYVKATAIAASAGAWVRIFSGPWNITWFGAVSGLVVDCQPAIQGAINLGQAFGGATLYAPAGSYLLGSGLLIDNSAIPTGPANRFVKRINILGDGENNTVFSKPTGSGAALTILGAPLQPGCYTHLKGFRLSGNAVAGSIGINMIVGAYLHWEDLSIEAWETGFQASDIEQCLFTRLSLAYNTVNGGLINAATLTTSPNSLTFEECNIGGNGWLGLQITNANTVNFIGGSFQYNGITGASAFKGGLKLVDPGNGYGTITINGTIFEGNGGDSDLFVYATSDPVCINIDGVGFMKTSPYATNNIKLGGFAAVMKCNIRGTAFRSNGSYTANAARPVIARDNLNAEVFDQGGNYYQNAVEKPAASAKIFKSARQLEGFTFYSPNVANGAQAYPTVTVLGAVPGDFAQASFNTTTGGVTLHAHVDAADLVTVVIDNRTGVTWAPGLWTLKARVTKQGD